MSGQQRSRSVCARDGFLPACHRLVALVTLSGALDNIRKSGGAKPHERYARVYVQGSLALSLAIPVTEDAPATMPIIWLNFATLKGSNGSR